MTKQEWISRKIGTLIGEGKPQQQAIAIAYSMWEEGSKKQEGGDTHYLPMAQEAITPKPVRRMNANNQTYDMYGNVVAKYQDFGGAPFNSNNYGIPVTNPINPAEKGFYPTQGNIFPNSLTYGVPTNPNYGKSVSTTNGNPNWGKTVSSVNPSPTTSVVNNNIATTKKTNKGVIPAAAEAATTATTPTTTRTLLTPLLDGLAVGNTNGTIEEQLQASASEGIKPLTSTGVLGAEENSEPEMDWVKYNILNPYGQGMDLGTSLAYTGQQFGKGNTGMGIAGAGLSALKGVRSFLSGYGSGKGQRNIEQEMKDKLYNSDEQLYRGNKGVFKEGGEVTNADLLTGNYITQEGQEDPNIEIEHGEHTKNAQTGEVQEAVGDKHIEGGISVNLPDQSKVLSDYTKIGSSNAKTFEGMFDVKLKATDTFATVLDKYNKKIGVKKLEEEEKELIEKVEKNSKTSIDKTTKQINEDFLAQEIAKINKQKEGLNKVKSEAFEAIFKEQEKIPKKGDGTEILDKSGNPVAQQGGEVNNNVIALAEQYGTSPEHILQILQEGQMKQEGGEQQVQGQPDPQQIIQAYAQMAGQDPNQVMQQLQQMPPEEQQAALQEMLAALQQGQEEQNGSPMGEGQEQPQMEKGGYTKAQQAERLNDFYKNAKGLGYEGSKDIGSIQKYMAAEHPEEVIKYFTENGQPLTAKHIDLLKEKYKSSFKEVGIDPDKASADYTPEEKLKLQDNISSRLEGDKPLYRDFLLQGFQDNKWDWRSPMLGMKPLAPIGIKPTTITAPGMSQYYNSPSTVEPLAETPAGVVDTRKPTTREPIKNIISTEGLPYIMPPSAPLAPYLQQVSLSRLEGQKGSVENQLQASENSRQAAYEGTKGLPPAQAAAMMANYLATSGQQDTAGIAQQEQQDLGNKSRIEQYNAGQSDKEQILNEQLKKQYEREAFGTLNANEQNWRSYYDANQANQKAASDEIERRNIMNLGLTNYQLNGSGGFDFVNKSPFQKQSQPSVEELEAYSKMTPAEKEAYKKAYAAKSRLS